MIDSRSVYASRTGIQFSMVASADGDRIGIILVPPGVGGGRLLTVREVGVWLCLGVVGQGSLV